MGVRPSTHSRRAGASGSDDLDPRILAKGFQVFLESSIFSLSHQFAFHAAPYFRKGRQGGLCSLMGPDQMQPVTG